MVFNCWIKPGGLPILCLGTTSPDKFALILCIIVVVGAPRSLDVPVIVVFVARLPDAALLRTNWADVQRPGLGCASGGGFGGGVSDGEGCLLPEPLSVEWEVKDWS